MSAIYSLRWPRDVVEYIVWEVDQGVYHGYVPRDRGSVESHGSVDGGRTSTSTPTELAIQRNGN